MTLTLSTKSAKAAFFFLVLIIMAATAVVQPVSSFSANAPLLLASTSCTSTTSSSSLFIATTDLLPPPSRTTSLLLLLRRRRGSAVPCQKRRRFNNIVSSLSTTMLASSSPKSESETDDAVLTDLPWSEVQSWALRDQLPRYTVQIPVVTNNNNMENNGGRATTMKVITLWRTLSEEVTELSGYPLPFLVQRARAEILTAVTTNNENDNPESSSSATTTAGAPSSSSSPRPRPPRTLTLSEDILPYLDEFEFESAGGLSGRVYGVPGVADGSNVRTAPVGDVQVTVPKGFVRTEDGTVIYELGKPLRRGDEPYSSYYSMDGTKNVPNAVQKAANNLAKALPVVGTSNMNEQEENPDADLVRLGGLTAAVLAGAVAIDILSHHLTINMFWV